MTRAPTRGAERRGKATRGRGTAIFTVVSSVFTRITAQTPLQRDGETAVRAPGRSSEFNSRHNEPFIVAPKRGARARLFLRRENFGPRLFRMIVRNNDASMARCCGRARSKRRRTISRGEKHLSRESMPVVRESHKRREDDSRRPLCRVVVREPVLRALYYSQHLRSAVLSGR